VSCDGAVLEFEVDFRVPDPTFIAESAA
jgi:hypothetical protein